MREDSIILNLLTRGASLFMALMLAVTMCLSLKVDTKAAYKYTVRIYAGKQGTFNQSKAKQVLDPISSNISYGSKVIVIKDVTTQDSVQLYAEGMVNVSDSSKYLVKGLRKSGTDNDTVNPSQRIKGDQDFVIGYKMVDELVEYTIHYVDGNNNKIASDETHYGNAGESMVVAFPYIEGYTPRAYNGRITLSSDESKNEFYFPYRQITQQEEEEEEEEEETNNNNNNANNNNNNTNTNNTNTNTNTDTGTGAGTGTGADAAAADDGADDADNGDNGNEPDDLIDIGNNEIPQAEFPTDDGSEEATTEDEYNDIQGEIDDSQRNQKNPWYKNPFILGLLALVAILAIVGGALYFTRNMGKPKSGAKKPGASGGKKPGAPGAAKPGAKTGAKPAGKPGSPSGKKPGGKVDK